METTTVTYPVCGGNNGRRCGKVLSGANDGIVVHGHITSTGPDADRGVPIVGSKPGVRDGSPAVHALCWACFHARVQDPVLIAARRDADNSRRESSRGYDSYESTYDPYPRPGKSASGPLVPPELPHYVKTTAALCRSR